MLGNPFRSPVRYYRRVPAPIRVLSIGVLINRVGGFVITFLALILAIRHISTVGIGIALALSAVFAIIGSWLGGALIPRLGSRQVIFASMAGSAVFTAALVFPGPYALTVAIVCLISLFNRAQVSQMVALAGLQSLISWSGTYRGNLIGAEESLILIGLEALGCCVASAFGFCDSCACDQLGNLFTVYNDLNNEVNNVDNKWNNDDKNAAQQAKWIVQAAGLWRDWETATYGSLLINVLPSGRMAQQVFNGVNTDINSEVASDVKNFMSVNSAVKDPQDKVWWHSISATMGSRASTFVTARDLGFVTIGGMISKLIQSDCTACIVLPIDMQGGSGFGSDREQSQTTSGISGDSAWGEDHGNVTMFTYINDCVPFVGFGWSSQSHVRASSDDGTQEHDWGGNSDSDTSIHKLGGCTQSPCPDMWPLFVDYEQNNVNDDSKLFGQPVLYALGTRDMTKEPKDPWNLNFNFKVFGGSTFDNMDPGGNEIKKSGMDKQASLSAAITYYHRPNPVGGPSNFKEPPNFFNPFWRATLYKPSLDADITLTGAGLFSAAATFTGFKAVGFHGGM